jgi:hypothetical protein
MRDVGSRYLAYIALYCLIAALDRWAIAIVSRIPNCALAEANQLSTMYYQIVTKSMTSIV